MVFIGCGFCNGVTSPGSCPVCGDQMEDLGMVEDYNGPYSPYQDGELIEQEHKLNNKGSLVCIHLVHCPTCKYEGSLNVPI